MIRTLTCLVLGLVLLSPPAVSAASAASAASAVEPADRFTLRWALLLGLSGESSAALGGVSEEAGEELLEWDFRRDDQELIELFRLTALETLQQGTTRFSGSETRATLGGGDGDERVDVEVVLSIQPFESEGETQRVARAAFTIRRHGEVVSAPTILTALGQRAIVTTRDPDQASLLYLVLQVDPAGGEP